ncbi:hypothetical protein [Chromobacterium haemolyticum]|uniref:hypothetical protein n=1 Tax=Chromobacterium haemolyticum TaxID=394935 RepID=UPI000B2F99A3|nr:hypothetical protein [Chromobacterium haemolyticum]
MNTLTKVFNPSTDPYVTLSGWFTNGRFSTSPRPTSIQAYCNGVMCICFSFQVNLKNEMSWESAVSYLYENITLHDSENNNKEVPWQKVFPSDVPALLYNDGVYGKAIDASEEDKFINVYFRAPTIDEKNGMPWVLNAKYVGPDDVPDYVAGGTRQVTFTNFLNLNPCFEFKEVATFSKSLIVNDEVEMGGDTFESNQVVPGEDVEAKGNGAWVRLRSLSYVVYSAGFSLNRPLRITGRGKVPESVRPDCYVTYSPYKYYPVCYMYSSGGDKVGAFLSKGSGSNNIALSSVIKYNIVYAPFQDNQDIKYWYERSGTIKFHDRKSYQPNCWVLFDDSPGGITENDIVRAENLGIPAMCYWSSGKNAWCDICEGTTDLPSGAINVWNDLNSQVKKLTIEDIFGNSLHLAINWNTGSGQDGYELHWAAVVDK